MTSLKPPACFSASTSISCEQVDGRKAMVLFAGLYLVALGVGGIKGSLPPHGAEQFDEKTLQGRKQRSAFFNYYVFCLSCGALIAVTLVVWVEDNKGWQWGFGVSTATILLSIPIFLIGSPVYRTKVPIGSPITTIFKVRTQYKLNPFMQQNKTSARRGHLNLSPLRFSLQRLTTPTGSGILAILPLEWTRAGHPIPQKPGRERVEIRNEWNYVTLQQKVSSFLTEQSRIKQEIQC